MATSDNASPLAYTIPDACKRLSLGRSTVYALLTSGELKSFYIGARRLVSDATLVAFVAKREHGANNNVAG